MTRQVSAVLGVLFLAHAATAQFTQQVGRLIGTGAVGAAEQGMSVPILADGNAASVAGRSDSANTGAAWTLVAPADCTPPSITAQPQNTAITSGQTATLSVTATGTASLNYQWYQGSSGDTSQPIGTNAASFTTPALTTNTSYWVRVSNACGHADSATATVSTNCQAPTAPTAAFAWGASLDDPQVRVGDTVDFVDQSTGGPTAWSWDFGDAVPPLIPSHKSTLQSPSVRYTATGTFTVTLTATNCRGSKVVQHQITVAPACDPPVITLQPQSLTITSAQTTTLSVTATGTAPLSYQWYQGSSGDTSHQVGTNAASFTTPALIATTSFWVRVSNSCGHAASATATITVEPVVVWVPVASHVAGKNNSRWRSDLGMLNAGAVTANVQIKFFGSAGVVTSTTYVSPHVQSILTDVVGQLPASDSGALEILSDRPLKVTARTYNQVASDASCYPNGTQGQDYPAVVASEGLAAGQSAYLPGLTENPSYHCNIGVVNVGPDAATVQVELFDGAGTELAGYTVNLAAGQWSQVTQPFKNGAGQTAMDRGYATITVQTGSGVFGFASVIDNLTNDPTTVMMQK
jgi:PKD repeat protein